MKKASYLCLLALIMLLLAPSSHAQLPKNPWAQPGSSASYHDDETISNTAITRRPSSIARRPGTIAKRGSHRANNIPPRFNHALPVNPWTPPHANDNINSSWRHSGRYGALNYTGEATIWTDTTGQEKIAPEVNRHNMLIMTEHLRSLGYKIPESYDTNIREAPARYKRRLEKAYQDVQSQSDPLSTGFTGIMRAFEKGTGLDTENLLFNTMDILSKE